MQIINTTPTTTIGGIVLDNLPGFRTLGITGREEIEPDKEANSGRDLTVRFRIYGGGEYWTRFNNAVRDVFKQDSPHVVFSDESDKYFIADSFSVTQSIKVSECEAGHSRGILIAELVLHCDDPYKYATTLKEFQATDGVLNIENTGSAPAYIDYTITTPAETGVIGIVSKDGVLQYGKADELDGAEVENAVTVFNTTSGDFTGWSRYTGTHPQNEKISCGGTLSTSANCGKWADYQTESYKVFSCSSFGTDASSCSAFGGCMRYTVTNPVTNFYTWFQIQFATTQLAQTGHLQIALADETNKFIAAAAVSKNSRSSNNVYTRFYIASDSGEFKSGDRYNKIFKTFDHTGDLGGGVNGNPYCDTGCMDLKKIGGDVTFYYWGQYFTIHSDLIKDAKVKYIYVFIGNHHCASANVNFMNVGKFSGTNLNALEWKDIPNRFKSGDRIEIEGETGTYKVNGQARPQDENIGSTYFMANPGNTEIQIAASSWATAQPTVTARIRERWL